MRAREREAAWRRAASAVQRNPGSEAESSLPKTPRGRVQRSAVKQSYSKTEKRLTQSETSICERHYVTPKDLLLSAQVSERTMVCV